MLKFIRNIFKGRKQQCNLPVVSGSVFDDKIDEWHNSDTQLSLYEYMGLTEEQYKIWLKTSEEIEKHYR